MNTEVLQVILYVLGALLLGVLIVLSIKLIVSIDRVNSLLDSVDKKMKTVDKIFDVVDKMTDSFATVSDKIVDGLSGFVSKLMTTKSKRRTEIEDEEDE